LERRTLVLLALLPGLLPLPALAEATDPDDDEPPVAAVIPFGAQAPARAGQVTAACEQALRRIKGLKVITGAEWEKEARISGQGDDLEAMARRLAADVLVTGSLSPVRKPGARPGAGPPTGWRLSLDILDDHAQPIESVTLDLLVPEIGPAAAFRMEEALARIIRPAVGLIDSRAPKDPEPEGPEPSPQEVDRERERAQELPKPAPLRDPPRPRPKIERPPWRPLFAGRVGLLVSARRLTCSDEDRRRVNLPCSEPAFPFDAGAGLHLDLSLYPAALMTGVKPALAGLGVRLLLQVPAWRERTVPTGASTGVKEINVSAQELRVEGGLDWRWNIGDAVLRPILHAGLSYGYHHFVLDGTIAPYPDMQYQYLLPTLGVSVFPLPRLTAGVDLSFLGIFTAGAATAPTTESNQNTFGTGSALGFRFDLAGEYLVWRGLLVGLGLYVEQVWFSLNGQGCTKSEPGQGLCDFSIVRPPNVVPPPGIRAAEDLYVGGWMGLGYRY
jgi:hypothetical protein